MKYYYSKEADRTRLELNRTTQQKGENAEKFGLRLKSLLNRLLILYESDPFLLYYEKKIYKQESQREAYEQFLYGLRADLRDRIRTLNPECLEDAITKAAFAEKTINANRVTKYVNIKSPENMLFNAWLRNQLAERIGALCEKEE